MTTPALLIVTMQAPAGMEDEFNDWYDTEHFPQRRGLPGFGECTRWVCIEGWPRYLALYDMDSAATVETPEYRACSGPRSTPWSRRILPRTIGRLRVIATEILADGTPPPRDRHLLAARYPMPSDAAARRHDQIGLPGLTTVRWLRDGDDLWLFARFDRPVSMGALIDTLGTAGDTGASFFNLCVPYFRAP
jgi:hypothetical protein